MRLQNFASKEDKKRLPEIKESEMKRYTKDDFLSAAKLVKELGLPKDVIEKAMRDLRFKQAKIVIHNHKTMIIVGNNSRTLRVHPLGLSIFKEYLLKQNEAKK